MTIGPIFVEFYEVAWDIMGYISSLNDSDSTIAHLPKKLV